MIPIKFNNIPKYQGDIIMSYRNVDYTKKKKSKPSAKKSNLVKSDKTGTFKYERTGTRHGKRKNT